MGPCCGSASSSCVGEVARFCSLFISWPTAQHKDIDWLLKKAAGVKTLNAFCPADEQETVLFVLIFLHCQHMLLLQKSSHSRNRRLLRVEALPLQKVLQSSFKYPNACCQALFSFSNWATALSSFLLPASLASSSLTFGTAKDSNKRV